jgi:hypothetical protein
MYVLVLKGKNVSLNAFYRKEGTTVIGHNFFFFFLVWKFWKLNEKQLQFKE